MERRATTSLKTTAAEAQFYSKVSTEINGSSLGYVVKISGPQRCH